MLRVADVAELPALMQTEVGARRSAVESGPLTPVPVGPMPFLAAGHHGRSLDGPGDWPAVEAYPVTRLRPGADLFLRAPNGDPLLASHFAGSGRVVALPAGLGPWTPAWPAWTHWGAFLGGLLQWAAADPTPGLHLEAEGAANRLVVRIDAVGAEDPGRDSPGDWRWDRGANGTPRVEVRDPAGRWQEFDPEPTAPGRYEREFAAPQSGRYDIRARAGGRSTSLALWHQPPDEFLPVAPAQLDALAGQGLLRAWSPDAGGLFPAHRRRASRPLLLALALGSYLLALAVERLPPPYLGHPAPREPR